MSNQRLWVEWASRQGEGPSSEADVIHVRQREQRFFAVLVSGLPGSDPSRALRIAESSMSLLEQGCLPEGVVDQVVGDLSDGKRMPFSVIDVSADNGSGELEAHLAQCDAPPVLMTRWEEGRRAHALFLPPVVEDSYRGSLVRRCQFRLQDRDHLAIVGEGYFRVRGWVDRWVWRDIATYTRRWTATGCSAEQLVDALISTYERRGLSSGVGEPSAVEMGAISAVTMTVRPARTVTVWTGPPADSTQDPVALSRLMAEFGTRVICGDTTAKIAARLLEDEPELGSRPAHGWREVPPVLDLKGVHLVTEGLVTMGRALEHLSAAEHVRDVDRADDGATRLARILLEADLVRFVVGMALNPQQSDGSGVPLRRGLVERMVDELRNRGKIVGVACL